MICFRFVQIIKRGLEQFFFFCVFDNEDIAACQQCCRSTTGLGLEIGICNMHLHPNLINSLWGTCQAEICSLAAATTSLNQSTTNLLTRCNSFNPVESHFGPFVEVISFSCSEASGFSYSRSVVDLSISSSIIYALFPAFNRCSCIRWMDLCLVTPSCNHMFSCLYRLCDDNHVLYACKPPDPSLLSSSLMTSHLICVN